MYEVLEPAAGGGHLLAEPHIPHHHRCDSTTPSLQTTVQLVPSLTQSATGTCPGGANYWDIGVYGDASTTNHGSGLTLSPFASILTNTSGYQRYERSTTRLVHQYCNGSRVPPEIAPLLCSGPNGNANAPGCIQPGNSRRVHDRAAGVPDINQFYRRLP